jgi:putative phosphoesterase
MNPVRVALLADTHGHLEPRVAALAHTCDWIVHAGDIGSADVLAQLQAYDTPTLAIHGNNDTPAKWPPAQGSRLAQLSDTARLALPGGELIAVHGDRHPAAVRHARLRAEYPQARVIVYGHSHRLLIDDTALPWLLNPGAAGRTRTYGGASCLILIAAAEQWQVEVHRFTSA